jgi:hypothetical protein
LLLEFGRVKPVGKLDEIVGATFGRDEFVIADCEIDGSVGERRELILDEVVPGIRFVIFDERGRGGELFVVLVDIVDGAEVAEVPVESGLVAVSAGGDGGHDYVSAVAGIAGDGERPGRLGLGYGCEEQGCE